MRAGAVAAAALEGDTSGHVRPDEPGVRDVFAALSNHSRLAIIDVLSNGDTSGPHTGLSISEIASLTELSRFSASRHLGILRAAGVVVAEPVGMSLRHRVAIHALEQIEDWLCARTVSLSESS